MKTKFLMTMRIHNLEATAKNLRQKERDRQAEIFEQRVRELKEKQSHAVDETTKHREAVLV